MELAALPGHRSKDRSSGRSQAFMVIACNHFQSVDPSFCKGNQELSTEIDISITGSPYNSYSSETRLLKEISSLAYMMKVLKHSVVFEIGTFIGRTTRLLADKTPENSKIYTLDLPGQLVSHPIGRKFLDTPQADKIVQLNGDSMDFDFSPWYG